MPWYRATKQSFINGRDVLPGQVIQYDGQAGSALKPMSDEEVEKHLDALDVPPTRSVEQRLDEIELTIGRDNIRRAIERDGRLRAKLAADARADKTPKAADDKDKTDPNAEKAKAKAEA